MQKLKPLRDRLVIKPFSSSKTAGGLYIPDTAKDKQTAMGRVVQVGPGLRRDTAAHDVAYAATENASSAGHDIIPMDVKIGDTVLFMRYSGVEISIAGETMVMVRDHEVLGIFEE